MRLPATCRGPVGLTRRNMLQIGAIGALNLSLPQLLAANRNGSRTAATADSCILVFLNGGPSHLDMWDMKPNLPQEMRSEFKPISTNVTGVQVCEHLPKLARQMNRCTLVRSVHHNEVAHAPAVYTSLTGVPSGVKAGLLGAKPTDHPSVGSALARYRPPTAHVPPYVLLPYLTLEGAGGPPQPGYLGGWLGKSHDPFLVLKGGPQPDGFNMPALAPGPDVTADRAKARAELLNAVNRTSTAVRTGESADLERLQGRACDLLTSAATRRAFRIEDEPARVRDAYGRNIYGQSLLLSRRLVEAGTRLACVSWAPDANATWDTHGGNFTKLKNELLPQFDLGFSQLLADLSDRGLLERTLVVAMGEIGRTPKINGGAGRDHWEFCYSVVYAGGGTKGGFVYGSSDKHGAYPSANPVTAGDVIATIYQALGLSADLELRDRLDRPIPLVPNSAPITDVFA